MRKILGILAAVLALAGAEVGSRTADSARTRTTRLETERAANAAAQRASDSLMAIVSDLKLKADNAAANPRLVFALQGNVDERTMRDLWRTEEWWRPWRTEFKVYAVAMSAARLDVVEGIDAADLDTDALVRHVRDKGETSAELVVGKGWPYAATATAVRVPGREKSPVLVLAKPIDQPALRKLADRTGGAVILTDGRKTLIDAGPATERDLLVQAIGSESNAPVFHGAGGSWAAATTRVGPGLWLWTYAAAGTAVHEAQTAATERKLMLWLVAALVAGMALFLGLRQQRGADPLPGGTMSGLASATGPGPQTGAEPSATMENPGTMRGQGPGPRPTTIPGTGDMVGATRLASPPPTTPAPPATNESAFGRYTLLDRLGEGGMAEVYTAVTFGAQGFRRKFVIKRLRAELAREPAVVDQFIDEANLASSMVHSNIVPVFDFGKVGDEYFMAQEYILGRDLARLTKRSLE
ncbi:MAG: hypothetical protein ABUL77_04800, partial [Bacteroidota bacterium]